MVAPEVASIVSEVTFQMRIQHISQLGEARSSQFIIQGIPWRVRITKSIEQADEFLAINLHCESSDKSLEWTQPATASFKLLSFNGNSSAKVCQLEPHVFNSVGNNSGCRQIRWSELLESAHFLKDDTIILEVHIDVADPFDKNQTKLMFEGIDNCCERGRFGSFRLTVHNINNLMAIRSPQFMLRNKPWYLKLFKMQSYLGLRLEAKNSSDKIISDVNALVKIISSNARMQTLHKIQAHPLRRKDGFVMERLMTWDDLIKPQNGFINNGSIVVEIDIHADTQQPVNKAQGFVLRRRQSEGARVPAKMPRIECSICKLPIDRQNVSFIPCGHIFCTDCIVNSVRNGKFCPTCNTRVNPKQIKPLHLEIVT